MINAADPGNASVEQLQQYWRLSSPRAARELARKLGVLRIKGTYPWFAIWAAEGLAKPKSEHWRDLKKNHYTTTDVAKLLALSRRQAQRHDDKSAKPDFPDALPIREKPKLWRQAQVNAWISGLRVPRYRLAPREVPHANNSESRTALPHSRQFILDPFEKARTADTENEQMT